MKKKIIIGMVMTLVILGTFSGCIDNPLEIPLTFSELVDEYQERYPDSEIFLMWGNDSITVYHNCTSDEWIEWLDNLTRKSQAIRWENYTPPEQKYGFTIFHRYIDPSLESYVSIDEKNAAKKEILINMSLVKKESLMNRLWDFRDDISTMNRSGYRVDRREFFDTVANEIDYIYWCVLDAIHIDGNYSIFNKSYFFLQTIIDNLSSAQSLYWKTHSFYSYVNKSCTSEILNNTDMVILYSELLFDLISERENVPIHVYSSELGSLFFNFTGDGLVEAMEICGSASCSIHLPKGVIQITRTINIPSWTYLSGSSNIETVLYTLGDDLHSVLGINGSNVTISNMQIFIKLPNSKTLAIYGHNETGYLTVSNMWFKTGC